MDIAQEQNLNDKVNKQSNNNLFSKLFPLGFKDEAILIYKNAIPLTLSTLSQALLTMMSLFFCGHIGPNELAAASIANTFIHIGGYAPLLGFSSACDTLFPQLYGSSDKKKVGIILQKGLIISVLTSIPCMGFLLNAKYIMKLFIKEDIVIALADEYAFHFAPTFIFFSIQIIISKYLQCQNIFYPILIINIGINVLNACLQGLLVFWVGFGIVGAAISVLISNIVQVAVLIFYIVKKNIHEETWPGWSVDCLYDWKLYLKLGIAGFGMVVFEFLNFEIAVAFAGMLGSIELSIMAITIQIMFIIFMIPFGIAISGNIRVGQLLGENSPRLAFNSVKVIFTVSATTSIITMILIYALSGKFPLLFTNHSQIIEESSYVLKFLSLISLLDGLQICGNGFLRSLGAQMYGFIIAFLSYYLIGLPIGIYLLLKTSYKVLGYWLGFSVAAIVLFTLQLIFIYKVNWEKQAEKASTRTFKKRNNNSENNSDEAQKQHQDINESISNDKVKNLKRKIFKKIILFSCALCLFIISLFTRGLTKVKFDENLNNDFNNSTFKVY